MKITFAKITLITLLVLSPVFADDSLSPFEEIIWKEEKTPQISLLYLIISADEKTSWVDSVEEIVITTLPKALIIAKNYRERHKNVEFNVVYFIKTNKNNNSGHVSGFSIKQLEEMDALTKDKAREKVMEHAWDIEEFKNIK